MGVDWIPFPYQIWDKLSSGGRDICYKRHICTLSPCGFYVRIGFKAVVGKKNERKQNQYFSAGPP
jgi:hypothetical protein